MCSAIDNEIKHINKALVELVKGQERNDAAHIKIAAHVAVSVERWEEQKKLNEIYREDINKVDNRNKIFAGLNGIAAIIAGVFGVNR